jgi:hypothetical protein
MRNLTQGQGVKQSRVEMIEPKAFEVMNEEPDPIFLEDMLPQVNFKFDEEEEVKLSSPLLSFVKETEQEQLESEYKNRSAEKYV